ncbi:MAG: 4Fe-4S dicluster domain-containing protein [Candidatus Gastranaerophilales bacterium]
MSDKQQKIEEKLYTVKSYMDCVSHLKPNSESCQKCSSKVCTFVCPAGVYEWNSNENRLVVNYENCLECGACRICCEDGSLGWEYPKGTKGVMFKQG